MPDGNRMTWIDTLRLLAGVSMLCLHATSDPSGQPWVNYPVEDRYAPLFLRAALYIARTELFIIISCFLLLLALDRGPRSYGQVIAEQTRRLLIPYLFWTVFFVGFNLIKANAFGYFDSALKTLSDPWGWAGFLILGDVKYHMHFLPTLFGVVLFFPVFRLATRYPVLGVSAVVFLIAKYELDSLVYHHFWGHDALPYLVRAIKIATYVGYGMIAGAALCLWQTTQTQQRRSWFGLLVICAVILFVFKLIATVKTAQSGAWPFTYIPGYWADFLFPAVLFGFCMSQAHLNWPRWIARLAPYSFGLYLCHPIFHDLFEIFVQTDTALSPIIQVSLKICFTLITTSVLVYALAHLKPLAWTIGLGPLPKFARWLNLRRSNA